MIKRLFALLFILSALSTYAQDGTEKVSFSFENSTRVEVLEQLESLTPYRFFFVDDCFNNQKKSGQYEDTAFRLILNDLFTNTVTTVFPTTFSGSARNRKLMMTTSQFFILNRRLRRKPELKRFE